jgi:cation diffusion facilitator CzcD-associated flavoprotein CzcO
MTQNEDGAVGGTWKDHDYPNCGTDTEVCVYYPAFLPRPKTMTQFGSRDEILSYFREVARTHVGPKRFLWNTKLSMCRFDGSVWRLQDASGQHVVTARFILPCIYSISCKHPIYPNIARRDVFTGDAVHSSRLDKSLERFRDKKVVIIGCGASTLQIAPAVATVAASCTVLRRTMPYIKERPASALPNSDAGFTFWRTLYEIRNDCITFFDGWRRVEILLRAWFLFFNYPFRGSPAEARPPFEQPVQCTRRCYDYCGFMDSVRAGRVAIRNVSDNPIVSFQERALLLADGSVVDADVVVFATGYNIAAGGSDLQFEVAGQPHAMSNRTPNVFMPLSGCPLYCVPPRVAEESMPYFVRCYRSYMALGASGALLFYPNPPQFRKSDSILFSPACNSKRYTQGRDPNQSSEVYGSNFADVLGVPVPRAFFKLYIWGQRALHIPHPAYKSMQPPAPLDAQLPFQLVRKTLGRFHGCRPAPSDGLAMPQGGAPLRYLAECVAWPAFYLVSLIVGAEYKY